MSSTTRNFSIRSRELRQLTIYTDKEHTPESAYPIGPRGVITVALTEEQVAFVRTEYGKSLLVS